MVHLNCAGVGESTIQYELREALLTPRSEHSSSTAPRVPPSLNVLQQKEVLVFLGKVSADLTRAVSFIQLLTQLFAFPSVRVLVTTGATGSLTVDGVAEHVVTLGPLDDDSSQTLLKRHWSGALPPAPEAAVKSAIHAAEGSPSQIIDLARRAMLYRPVTLQQLDATAPYLHIAMRPPPVMLDLSHTSCLRVLSDKLEALGKHLKSSRIQLLWRKNGARFPVHIRADLKMRPIVGAELMICEQLSLGCFGLVWCALGCGWEEPPLHCCPELSIDALETLMGSPARPRILVVALRYGAFKVCCED